jgi:hypothetical protein
LPPPQAPLTQGAFTIGEAMTNTSCVTTARQGGAVTLGNIALSALPATSQLPLSEPPNPTVLVPTCQGGAKSHGSTRLSAGRNARRNRKRKMTFDRILSAVQSENISRLKDRAFAANRLAKITAGTSRQICYRTKDKAINALLRYRAASLSALELSVREAEIGIAFVGGGRLHTKPSSLDSEARNVLQQQLITIFNAEHHGMANVDGSKRDYGANSVARF